MAERPLRTILRQLRRLIATATGRRLNRLHKGVGYAIPLFTPDGQSLLLAGNCFIPLGALDKTERLSTALSLWDPMLLKLRRTFAVPRTVQDPDRRWIRAIALSPDGRTVATAEDRSALLYELATGSLRRAVDGHRGGVSSLAFTADGKRLVTASWDHTALVWDVAQARQHPDNSAVP
jgi:WD40 repeat protein